MATTESPSSSSFAMRFFGSSKANSRPSSRPASPARQKNITCRINVDSYGCFMMHRNRVDEQSLGTSTSVAPMFHDREISGVLEVEVPRGMGRRRCRSIKLTMRSVCRLNMGDKRGWEKDVLFNRGIEVKGAIILEEGVQRFSFAIVVPYSLAPYDVTPLGDVRSDLIAELVGLGVTSVDAPLSCNDNPDLPPEDKILKNMTVSWSEPVAATGEEVPWLRGSVTQTRSIGLIYNPDPNNGVNALDDNARTAIDGLGPMELRYLSDVWTVSAVLKTNAVFPDPSPGVTLFYAAVYLEQKATITSPRDPKPTEPISSTTPFLVWQQGTKPAPGGRLGRDTPALWRGKEAGGKDEGFIRITGIGRLPNDHTGRPSTLEGIVTPIHVSHQLVFHIWYAVAGEDVRGNKLPPNVQNRTGSLRLMKHHINTIIPSCCCIPEHLSLPTYDSLNVHDLGPCALCKTPFNEQACPTCVTTFPHARHDHDPRMVGNLNGNCPVCELRFTSTIDDCNEWKNCACGFSCQSLEDRMQSVLTDDLPPFLTRPCTPPPKEAPAW